LCCLRADRARSLSSTDRCPAGSSGWNPAATDCGGRCPDPSLARTSGGAAPSFGYRIDEYGLQFSRRYSDIRAARRASVSARLCARASLRE
jgi:hypothetical protein